MFRNVASQWITAQLVALTDGSDVTTGTTTVYATEDGGTQASVGTATHKGNGLWAIQPGAAFTDAAHVVFTFVNALAVTQSVQVYTADQAAANALNASAKTIGFGTAGSGSSATSVVTSAINFGGATSVGTNSLAGRQVIFRGDTTTAALKASGARIISNTSGSTPTLTLNAADALTASPASGDIFAVL